MINYLLTASSIFGLSVTIVLILHLAYVQAQALLDRWSSRPEKRTFLIKDKSKAPEDGDYVKFSSDSVATALGVSFSSDFDWKNELGLRPEGYWLSVSLESNGEVVRIVPTDIDMNADGGEYTVYACATDETGQVVEYPSSLDLVLQFEIEIEA